MKTSEPISTTDKIRQVNLHQKLHKAKLAIGKVVKNSTAKIPTKSGHTMNLIYADLNAIMDVVEPVLLENDLLLLQPIQSQRVCTQIIDIESGASIESCMELPQGLAPQSMGSAITYYRRYTLQSILSLQAVDDDGQAASKEPKAKVKQSLTDERFFIALSKIKAGTYTVEELRENCELTKEQEAQL